jgi:hypothetical protein
VGGEPPAQSYELTAKEREALQAYFERRKPAPGIKVSSQGQGAFSVGIDHADQKLGATLLAAAVGDPDGLFMPALVTGLANATANKGKMDEAQLNFALSVIKGIEPRDPLEAMLAAQMAATHNAIMTFARRLNHVDNIPQQDSAERALNKLARTFTTQLEALKKYRSVGDQTVRVEHVTVNEGGQAIVGNVATGGGGERRKAETTP